MKYTADQLDALKFTNILVIGPYKTGKTQSCATLHNLKSRPWVKGQKLHVHDFDSGCQPLIRAAHEWRDELVIYRYQRPGGSKIREDATVARAKDPYLEFIININALYDLLDANGQWRADAAPNAPYAIVIDSLTSISDFILSYTLASRGKELGKPGVDGRQEYGLQMGKIVEAVKSLRDLPCYTIWLAHESLEMGHVEGTNPQNPTPTGEVHSLPVVTGKLAFTIGAEFGGVVYSRADGGKYEWQVQPSGTVKGAGTRLKQGLPARIAQDFNLLIE